MSGINFVLCLSHPLRTCITHLQCCKLHTVTVPERCSLSLHQNVSFIARDMCFLMTLFISVKIQIRVSTFGRNYSCNLICFKQCIICFEAPLTNTLNSWVSDWLWALRPGFDSQQGQEFYLWATSWLVLERTQLSGSQFSRMLCRVVW